MSTLSFHMSFSVPVGADQTTRDAATEAALAKINAEFAPGGARLDAVNVRRDKRTADLNVFISAERGARPLTLADFKTFRANKQKAGA